MMNMVLQIEGPHYAITAEHQVSDHGSTSAAPSNMYQIQSTEFLNDEAKCQLPSRSSHKIPLNRELTRMAT